MFTRNTEKKTTAPQKYPFINFNWHTDLNSCISFLTPSFFLSLYSILVAVWVHPSCNGHSRIPSYLALASSIYFLNRNFEKSSLVSWHSAMGVALHSTHSLTLLNTLNAVDTFYHHFIFVCLFQSLDHFYS